VTTPSLLNTPDRIIRTGMINAGLLQEADDPNSEQYAMYMPRLQDVIRLEQTQGLKLWLNYDLQVPLVAGQALYSLVAGGGLNFLRPMRAIQGYYLEPLAAARRPLQVLSRDEYTRLSTTVQQGAINSYFIDKQQTSLDVYFWLTPDTQAVTGQAHLIIQQQVQGFLQLNETMNFPDEWFIFLNWALADEICTGQPQAIMDRCQQRAETYRAALEAWDVEDASTMFTPDSRVMYETSRFR